MKNFSNIIHYDSTTVLNTEDERVEFFTRWLFATIIFKIDLPVILCHYPTKHELTEKESDLIDTILSDLTKYFYNHFKLYPYLQPGSFLKIDLEESLFLFKDKYPNIEKNENSKYMFGNDIEDLYTPITDSYSTLIITNLQIQNFPSNAVLYVDPNPNPYPFMDAQNYILKKMHRMFEENYVKTGRIPYTSEEEKNRAFEIWLLTLQNDPALKFE